MNESTPCQNVSTLERAVSAGLGGFVLARYGGRSVFGTVLAAGLLHRAATGHCAVYQTLGVDTADPSTPLLERSSVPLSKSIMVDAPPETLYPFFTEELSRLASLSPEVISVESLDADRSRWTVRTPVGRHTFESKIVERVENRSLRWECEDERFPHQGEVTLTPGPRGTVVRVAMTYHTPGGALAAQLSRVTGHEPHEALERTLCNLRSLLEAGEIPRSNTHPNSELTGKEIAR